MKALYADKKCQNKQAGYHAHYEPGDRPNTWRYDIRDPQQNHLCSGARSGTEEELIFALKKMLKRWNGQFGIASLNWKSRESARRESMTN